MKFNDLFPLKFLINLDSRPDRLAVCNRQEFPNTGLKDIQRMPGKVVNITKQRTIDGAIGCLLAHYDCLLWAHNAGQNVMIMEDDISFLKRPDLKFLLDHMAENLPKDFNMAYLGGNILRPHTQVNEYWSELTHCQSTVCYMVRYPFIETLLRYIPTDRFIAPIDVIYADVVIPNGNCYISHPMVCTQRKDVSDIEGVEVDYGQYLQRRYDENFVKM